MNKILVKLHVPIIEEKYDIWIPSNKRIHNVIGLIAKAVDELSGGHYKTSGTPRLYNKETGELYNINLSIKESTIRNGSEIILI